MILLLISFSLLATGKGQSSTPNNSLIQAVNEIYNETFYEEVTQSTLRDYGALRKCGEQQRQGIDVCVPYYNCDPNTKSIIQTGTFDGLNSIDIRFDEGENQCDHYLDVCCQLQPDNNTAVSSTTHSSTFSQSSSRPVFTSPPVSVTEGLTQTNSRGTTTRPESNGEGPTVQNDRDGDWSECGVRNTNGIDFTIKGNSKNVAQYGEFPWQVALLRTNYNKSIHDHQCICGGSLIRPNIVLTAAHCLTGLLPHEITIRAGEWDTQTTKERIPYQERLAIRTISHERFGIGAINDIGLVVLDRAYTKVRSIGLACLPSINQKIASRDCIATGWGKNDFGRDGAYSVILKKIELPTVPNDKCTRFLRKTRLGPHFKLHQSFMCAGGEAGKDTCTGDGGSALVCPDPNNSERYIQAGIVSWGIGCGQNDVPGVYSDVAKLRSWIDGNLRELESLKLLKF